MKLAVLRRAAAGPRGDQMAAGASLGLVAAAATIAVALLRPDDPATLVDLLACVFAVWALGWMLGPAYGGQPALRPEQFALLPVPRRRLALALLATGFVATTTAVTLVAFAALLVYAARQGAAAVAVALPGLLLQLAFVVVLSRVAASVLGALTRSRTGGVVTGLVTAAMLVLASSGWIVLVALESVLRTGFSDGFSLAVRVLPSSWALLAVDASGRGQWGLAALALAGLAVLVCLLALAWAGLLGPARLPRPVVRGSGRPLAATGPIGAVFARELRSTLRDPVRVQALVVAPAFAILSCLVPLAFGSRELLPFAGALTALMGSVMTTNLYGGDGTSLWLTLTAPRSEYADVRGRQLAWLAVYGPLAAVLTLAGGVLGGNGELWPWALAAAAAMIGGGAGVLAWVAVALPAPGPDPRAHRDSPLDHGDATGPAFVNLLLTLAGGLPAAAVAVVLTPWAAVPAALVTGVLAYALAGRAAACRLAARGPELLQLMRTGRPPERRRPALPAARRRAASAAAVVGCIALFPQAIVPGAMKLSGDVARVWFVALYLPAGWQWPVIALMAALGVGALAFAWRLYRS
jgi:hypothetical protein